MADITIVSRQGAIVQPPLKAITAHAVKVLKTELYPTSVVIIDSQGTRPTVVQTRGYGDCDLPDGTERPIIIPYLTTVMEDDFGESVEGGPGDGDQALSYETTPQNDAILGMNNFPDMLNRYQTDSHSGDGLTQDPYGAYDYTGSKGTHPARSTADRHVKKPKKRVLKGKGLKSTTDLAPGETPGKSTNPNDNLTTGVGIELAQVGGLDAAGIIFGGDNANGLMLNLAPKKGLAITDNQLGVVVDGKTVTFTADGALQADVTGTIADVVRPGRAILMDYPSTPYGSLDTSHIVVSLDIAMVGGLYQAGLCDTGGDDGNGVMINLVSAGSGESGAASLAQPLDRLAGRLFPSFLPSTHRSAFAAGHNAFLGGLDATENPQPKGSNAAAWWTAGWLGAQAGNIRYGLIIDPGGGGGGGGGGVVGGAGDGSDGSVDFSGVGEVGSASVDAAVCSGVLTGSGLTIIAGDGNSLALWLATTGGANESGLDFGGDDGEGLYVKADPAGAIAISVHGVATIPDTKTIIINSSDQLQAIGAKSGSPTPPTGTNGSGTGDPTSGGQPGTGSCVVAPVTVAPPTRGASPPPAGSAPGPANGGVPGYDCAGSGAASVATPTPWWGDENYSHNTVGAYTMATSTTGFDLETAVVPGHDKSLKSTFNFDGHERFFLFHVDLALTGGDMQFAQAPQDFVGSYWEGLVWTDVTQQWSFNGTGATAVGYQPGPRAYIACYFDCNRNGYWFLGTDRSAMHLVQTRTAANYFGATSALLIIGGFHLDGGHLILSGLEYATGIPAWMGMIDYPTSGSTTNPSGSPPDAPTSVPPQYDFAYQAGWAAYVSGVPEGSNPYAGSNPARQWWEAGWIDAANFYTGGSRTGGTSTNGTYTPPATPPPSIPDGTGGTTDYRPIYTEGYQAYLDGKPQVCPYTADQDPAKCQYWNEGWVDAFNAFHTQAAASGTMTGWMPGGSSDSASCLTQNAGTGSPATNPISMDGTVNITGDLNVSGCIDASCIKLAGQPLVMVPPPPSSGGFWLESSDGVMVWSIGPGGSPGMGNPMTAAGDIIYGTAGNTAAARPAALHIGNAGDVLTVVNGLPAWHAPAAAVIVGTAPITVDQTGGQTTIGISTTGIVTAINGQHGAVTMVGTNGITVSQTASTITIDGAGGGGGGGGTVSGLNWRGVYNGADAYAPNDAVFYNGSAYICTAATAGNVPTNVLYWDLLAEEGSQGIQGIQGPAGVNWQGAWSPTSAYNLHDAVFYAGSSYLATQASLNVTPTVGAPYWDVLAGGGSGGTGTIWAPLTNGDPSNPLILFDSRGAVVMAALS